MSEPRIDPYDAVAYGRFTAAQIHTLLLGLDPELDGTLRLMAARVSTASDGLEAALVRTGVPGLLLHRPEHGAQDPILGAREALRDLIHEVEGGHTGFVIVSRLLQGESLNTAVRRTPAKLLARLGHINAVMPALEGTLPDHGFWSGRVRRAHEALAALEAEVQTARAERRSMAPDFPAAWSAWSRTYVSAKHVVTGVLAGIDKVILVREVFDDIDDEERARESRLPGPI